MHQPSPGHTVRLLSPEPAVVDKPQSIGSRSRHCYAIMWFCADCGPEKKNGQRAIFSLTFKSKRPTNRTPDWGRALPEACSAGTRLAPATAPIPGELVVTPRALCSQTHLQTRAA